MRGTDSDASMTAFCLIAMQESRTMCAASVNVSILPPYIVFSFSLAFYFFNLLTP